MKYVRPYTVILVLLRGVYTTKPNIKKCFCSVCGEEIVSQGVVTFITPIFIRIIDRAKCAEEPNGFHRCGQS